MEKKKEENNIKSDNIEDFYVNIKPKSKKVAGVLGIFLGVFGVHNFYLGYIGKGLTQLLISVLSCFTLSPMSIIWGLVEGILILSGKINKDAQDLSLE